MGVTPSKTNDPVEASPQLPPAPDDSVRSQLETLLGQEQFRESPTLQRLLRYIVEETLATGGRDLKEYNLGVTVFKRGPEFDPRTDSIVRVQVGVLRKKLAAYYETSGRLDSVLIEIPRGHYAASFRIRPEAANGPPAAAPPPRRRWRRDLLLFCAGVLTAAVIVLPFRTASAPQPPFEWQRHPLWRGFFDPDSTTQLVMGAPLFVLINGMYVRDATVNSPDDLAHSARLHELAGIFHTSLRPEEIYTGLGEAAGLYSLGRFFAHGGKELPLVRNRLARWQDVAHGNLVLFSSFRFRSLGQEMELPRDFEFDEARTAIRNLNPRPGELAAYYPKFGGTGDEYDYALISVWPSPQSGRRIMSLSGAYTWGTQGAAEYVVDAPSLRDLSRRLDAQGIPKHDAGLQVVVKVLVKDRQPIATSYVTHHWLSEKPAR